MINTKKTVANKGLPSVLLRGGVKRDEHSRSTVFCKFVVYRTGYGKE